MTRIVTTHNRYKPAAETEGGAAGRPSDRDAEAKPTDTKKPEPTAAVVRKAWRR
jgi:hypothetical protein